MLSHISAKFAQPAKDQEHEPRAALFVNRFTRSLTIMYATSGIEEIVGISAENMRGRSFYYCIAENCLPDAIKCVENAKGNDSIAYLRFWFRDPRQDDPALVEDDSDEEMTTDTSIDNSSGGVDVHSSSGTSPENDSPTLGRDESSMDIDDESKSNSRNSSGDSTAGADTHEGIFGQALVAESSASSVDPSPERDRGPPVDAIELEAVVSCTSDGLVICMRKARPMIPHPMQRPSKPVYKNGLFAAPWATEPILPPIDARPGAGFGSSFAPALGPRGAQHNHASTNNNRPEQSDFMSAIRDQAVFAWGLTGINGSLAEFGHGKPLGESLPEYGLPVWASDPRQSPDGNRSSAGWHSGRKMFGSSSRSPQSPENGRRHNANIFGDPGLNRNGNYSNGSRSSGNSNGTSGGATPFPGPR